MPELPEVETVRAGLEKHIVGQTIREVHLHRPTLRGPIVLPRQALIGQRITAIERRSKYLIIRLQRHLILSHLGMSGRFYCLQKPIPGRGKHDHVEMVLTDTTLRYHDPRRFGIMQTFDHDTQPPQLAKLGPEPLTAAFHARALHQALQRRRLDIKQALMHPNIVVGVGNIYANEVLFKCGIHPRTPCNALPLDAVQHIVKSIRATLRAAIRAGGTTLKDFAQPDAKPGYFRHQLTVYGRHQQPCLVCATPIVRSLQHGRRSYFCPCCQAEKYAAKQG